jgi:hypothetical protein
MDGIGIGILQSASWWRGLFALISNDDGAKGESPFMLVAVVRCICFIFFFDMYSYSLV